MRIIRPRDLSSLSSALSLQSSALSSGIHAILVEQLCHYTWNGMAKRSSSAQPYVYYKQYTTLSFDMFVCQAYEVMSHLISSNTELQRESPIVTTTFRNNLENEAQQQDPTFIRLLPFYVRASSFTFFHYNK